MICLIIVVILQNSLVVHHKKDIMKIIITENKIYNIAKKQLTKRFGNLTPVEYDSYPNRLFYVDEKGNLYFELTDWHDEVMVDYDTIWSFLEDTFQLEYRQIQQLTKEWIEEYYNLEVGEIRMLMGKASSRWTNFTRKYKHNLAKQELTNRFGDLTPVQDTPIWVLYVDKNKKPYLGFNKETGYANFDYSILEFLENNFQFSGSDNERIIASWMEEYYNLDIYDISLNFL
jgi:hypothetical protein